MRTARHSLMGILLLCIFSASTPQKLIAEPGAGPFLVLKDSQGSGMFAVFSSVLGALDYFDRGSFAGINVNFDTGCYIDPEMGPNWWEYYFDPINAGMTHNPRRYTFTFLDSIHLSWTGFQLSRQRAHQLIHCYVHVRADIQAEIDAFISRHFEGHYVIGVHHRGTDKVLEHAIVGYDKTVKAVKEVIASLSEAQKANLRIYVATDDQHFVNYLSTLFPSILIYNDFVRSVDGTPLHYGENKYQSNYQKGKEAVLDCLLLSRCHILVRPATSCLSYMSTFFSPDMPVIALTNN